MNEHIQDPGRNMSVTGYQFNLTLRWKRSGDGGRSVCIDCFSSVYHIRLLSLLPLA